VSGSKSSGIVEAPELRERLRAAVFRLHAKPVPIASDAELFSVLIALYPVPVEGIWRQVIEPFLRVHADGLHQLYVEHAVWPAARVLDLAEALLVLERLDDDALRLERVWPLAPSRLDEVSTAWGVPLEQLA
jgi:hypothetical protein